MDIIGIYLLYIYFFKKTCIYLAKNMPGYFNEHMSLSRL